MCENIQNETVKCSYSLTPEHLAAALKAAGAVKTDKRKYVYSVVLALCCAVNAISYFSAENKNAFFLFLAVVSAVFIAVVWVAPGYLIKRTAKDNAPDGIINAEFFNDRLVLRRDDQERELNYSELSLINNSNLFIFSEKGRIVTAIPKDDISGENMEGIVSLLTSAGLIEG